MSRNNDKCSKCNSSSMEHCLRIGCKYWAGGTHLDKESRKAKKVEKQRRKRNEV